MLALFLIKCHTMKTYGGVKAHNMLHALRERVPSSHWIMKLGGSHEHSLGSTLSEMHFIVVIIIIIIIITYVCMYIYIYAFVISISIKFVPVHVMKTYRSRRSLVPLILDFRTV